MSILEVVYAHPWWTTLWMLIVFGPWLLKAVGNFLEVLFQER